MVMGGDGPATRVPDPCRPGRRVTKVWEVPATTNAIIELAGHLAGLGVEKVTVEATSDYWRGFFYLLEAAGLAVQLVNAREVKNVPGRPKTDRLDAVWLAKLTERGMLRPSFVPPAEIRQLRDYTRLRVDLTHERTRYWQRLEKLLEDALIKVSSVASTLDTASTRDMLEALIAGERDPRVLAGLARGKMKAKHAALAEALTGRFDAHHAELARMLLDQIDALGAQIGTLTARIEQLLGAIPAAQGVVAVARSILVIVWHLLADPAARYADLGADYYADRIDKGKKARNHIRQLEALGFTVTLAPAA